MGGSLLGIAVFNPSCAALAARGFPSSLEEEACSGQEHQISSEIGGVYEMSSAVPCVGLRNNVWAAHGLPLVIFDLLLSHCVNPNVS